MIGTLGVIAAIFGGLAFIAAHLQAYALGDMEKADRNESHAIGWFILATLLLRA